MTGTPFAKCWQATLAEPGMGPLRDRVLSHVNACHLIPAPLLGPINHGMTTFDRISIHIPEAQPQ